MSVSAAVALGAAGPWWLGTAGIGNLGRAVGDAAARATVDAAWEAGVRGFDTAPHYGLGLAERRLGEALAGRRREEFRISTKVGRLLEPVPPGRDDDRADDLANGFAVPAAYRRVWDVTPAGVERSLSESLGRLGLDRADVAYLHDPDEYDPAAAAPGGPATPAEALDAGLRALAALRERGAVGAVGVGSKSVPALTAAARSGLADVLMVAGRYTLLEQPAAELLRECAARGIAVVAVGVFNSGALSHAAPDPSLPYEYGRMPPEVYDRVTRIRTVCERHGTDLPTAALAFPTRSPAVAAIAVGAQSPAQVRENAARAAARVPAALWDDLAAAGLTG